MSNVIFYLEASSGGYLVRVAPDPNHQSDAAVHQMTAVSSERVHPERAECGFPVHAASGFAATTFSAPPAAPSPAPSPERVHPERAECGFPVRAPRKLPDFRPLARACTPRTHRIPFPCTRCVSLCRNHIFRSSGSTFHGPFTLACTYRTHRMRFSLYTLRENCLISSPSPERVHPELAECGFPVHAAK
jgi:hypothetical protein